MKKFSRFTALALSVAIAATAFTSCGGSAAKWEDGDGKIDGDLTFWTQDSQKWHEYFDKSIESFKQAYPDVNVKVEYFPEFANKLTQAFAADQQPDVMQTWQGVADWAKAGKIASVPETVFSTEELEKNFAAGALANKIWDGKYFCIPTEINVESPSLIVNLDILKEDGITIPQSWIDNNGPASWAELLEMAQKLTKKDGDLITRSGLAYNYHTWEANFLSLIWQFGGDYRDEANKSVHFDTPEAHKAAEMLLKYCKGPEAISDSGTVRYDAFTQQLAAMMVGAPWNVGSLGVDAPDINYQVFNMPAWVDGAKPISLATGGWGYIVSEKSKNKEAAWAFAKHMSSAEQVGDWALTTGALPSRTDALADLKYDKNVGSVEKAIAITMDILPFANEDGAYMLTPSTLVYTIVRDQLRQMLETGDIDTALKTMEAEGNNMIKENYNR
ncbi:MAG: extracellular solute-binding protein [Christensenella sp.]